MEEPSPYPPFGGRGSGPADLPPPSHFASPQRGTSYGRCNELGPKGVETGGSQNRGYGVWNCKFRELPPSSGGSHVAGDRGRVQENMVYLFIESGNSFPWVKDFPTKSFHPLSLVCEGRGWKEDSFRSEKGKKVGGEDFVTKTSLTNR